MDFWTHQESARRNTFWLVLLYAALVLGFSLLAAYVIDVYRGRMEPEECPVSYAAEILMFPKLACQSDTRHQPEKQVYGPLHG